MRPQQQNRRMRGRNNNNNNGGGGNNNNPNRKGPNPLTRSYESNGPDVKIRGSAQQIAEKYTTLARDATSSGDRVMAENYLQHAEHYNRIIAAAQAAMPIQNFQQNRDDFDDEDGEERDDMEVQGNGGEQPQAGGNGNGSGPQPVIEGMPAEVALNGETGARENNFRRERRDRNFQNGNRNGERNGEFRRDNRRNERNDEQPQAEAGDVAVEDSLPSFVTRTDVAPAVQQQETQVAQVAPADEAVAQEAPRRSRRPRRGERRDEAQASGQDEAPAAGNDLAPVEG